MNKVKEILQDLYHNRHHNDPANLDLRYTINLCSYVFPPIEGEDWYTIEANTSELVRAMHLFNRMRRIAEFYHTETGEFFEIDLVEEANRFYDTSTTAMNLTSLTGWVQHEKGPVAAEAFDLLFKLDEIFRTVVTMSWHHYHDMRALKALINVAISAVNDYIELFKKDESRSDEYKATMLRSLACFIKGISLFPEKGTVLDETAISSITADGKGGAILNLSPRESVSYNTISE